MPDFFDSILSVISSVGTWGYVLVALITVCETLIVVGQFLPGSVFLAFVGFLCYMQVFDLAITATIVGLSHYLGELLNYFIGREKGRGLFSPDARILKISFLEAVERQLARYGPVYFVICQFSGVLRPFLSFLAGASHYPLGKFLLWMVPACTLWTVVHLGIGFVLGASWREATTYLEDFSLLFLIAAIFIALAIWVSRTIIALSSVFGDWVQNIGTKLLRSRTYQLARQLSPPLFQFVEKRFSLTAPWGWKATAGFSMSLAVFLAFLTLGHFAVASSRVNFFDAALSNFLAQVRHQLGITFFAVVSQIGKPVPLCVLGVILGIFAALQRQWRSSILLSGTPLLTALLTFAMKQLFARIRPIETAVFFEEGFSYPSSHVAVSCATFLAINIWVWRYASSRRTRFLCTTLCLSLIFLIAYSRVYLGAHYLTDVIGGLLEAFSVLLFMTTLVGNIKLPEKAAQIFRPPVVAAASVALLLLAASLISSQVTEVSAEVRKTGVEESVPSVESILPQLPRYACRLTQTPSIPINVIMVGDLDRFDSLLVREQWRRVRPSAFYTREIHAPIFPAFVDAQPPLLTFEKRNGDERQILRIWPTKFSVNGCQVSVASIIREKLHRKWFGMQIFQVDPDLDLVVEQWCNNHVHSELRCRIEQGFRKRGFYRISHPFFTHGVVAIVERDQECLKHNKGGE